MPFPGSDDFNDLCMRIGFALATWQNVEEQHYRLFVTLLGVQMSNVTSVAYFSTESFEGRRKMVNAMFHSHASTTSELRTKWNGLEGDLKKQNEERNKLAHYGIDSEVVRQSELPDGSIEITFGESRLRPSRFNRVSELLGRTPDNPLHNLGPEDIDTRIVAFDLLAYDLGLFATDLWRQFKRSGVAVLPPPPIARVSPPPPKKRT